MGYLEINTDKDSRDAYIESFGENSALHKTLMAMPDELKLLGEQELADITKLTPIDYAMKRNFWQQYIDYRDGKIEKPTQARIYEGACRAAYFYQDYITNPKRVAWLVTPPTDSNALIDEAFAIAFKRVREDILTMEVTEKSAPILLKLFTYLAERKLGPMVQRVETKNLHVGVGMNDKPVALPTTAEELEAQLQKIKDRLDLPRLQRDVTQAHDE